MQLKRLMRTSHKSRRIQELQKPSVYFLEGKQIDALKIIVQSNHPSVLPIKERASEFLRKELNK